MLDADQSDSAASIKTPNASGRATGERSEGAFTGRIPPPIVATIFTLRGWHLSLENHHADP